MDNKASIQQWSFNRYSDANAIIRHLAEGIKTKIFVGKNTMLSFVRIKPYTQGSIHKHPQEQWGVLLEGECIRMQNDTEIKVKNGDFWYSAPNVMHGIRTEDKSAFILDIFSPPRPEYLSSGTGFGTGTK